MTHPLDQTEATTLRPLGSAQDVKAPDVKAYVLENRELFAGDMDLITALLPRALRDRNVLDLQGYVIARLREDAETIRAQGEALLAAAASNLIAQDRIHRAVLKLIEARSFGHLIHVMASEIGPDIGADMVRICIEAPELSDLPYAPPDGICVLPQGMVDHVLGAGISHLLNGGRKRMPTVYGRNTRRVRSEALLRLSFGSQMPTGLLVLGSFDDRTFAPDQRPELLTFLARAIERCMCGWLGLDEGD